MIADGVYGNKKWLSNAWHHPPRIQQNKPSSLADESDAIRGRVHAVIGCRGSFFGLASVQLSSEEGTCRAGVTNLQAQAVRRL